MTSPWSPLRLGQDVWEAVDGYLNEDRIRLAVTGLSRAGKTVFITSMIQNLLALSGGRDTLPALSRHLEWQGHSRLRGVALVPAGAASVPRFDHPRHLAALAAAAPAWPERTGDLAEVSLALTIERRSAMGRLLPPRRVRLDILDYPGEWLLDLPLLGLDYPTWSGQMLARLRRAPQAACAAPFLGFLQTLAVRETADEALLRRGHGLYRDALEACRVQLGLRYLQPGRFLNPGPRADVPFMWFFPTDAAAVPTGSAGALLVERFEAYKQDMRSGFFDTSFRRFDRQILLVDVLGALHAGQAAFTDTAEAIADLCAALGGPARWLGFGTAPIGHVAVVATKADHVPALRRDNLRHLLHAMTGPATAGRQAGRVSHHIAASVVSTVDVLGQLGGRSVEMVQGVLLGEDRARSVFTGDVPSGVPSAAFWAGGYFDLPVFRPPLIDASGRNGIAHLGIDEVLVAVLEDLL